MTNLIIARSKAQGAVFAKSKKLTAENTLIATTSEDLRPRNAEQFKKVFYLDHDSRTMKTSQLTRFVDMNGKLPDRIEHEPTRCFYCQTETKDDAALCDGCGDLSSRISANPDLSASILGNEHPDVLMSTAVDAAVDSQNDETAEEIKQRIADAEQKAAQQC